MQSFAWVGFAAFFVASLTCGLRLLALWRRNRELPELLIGLGVLGIGPVGFGFLTIGQLLLPSAPGLGRSVLGFGILATSVGVLAKFIFNHTVYHPGNRAIRLMIWAIGAGLLCAFVGAWYQSGFETLHEMEPVHVARSLLQIGCLLWGSVEALRYWRLLTRRLRLGLADPVVANRFLLWGIGAGAAGVGTAVGFTAQLWIGRPTLEIPWVTLSSSAHGFVAAVAMWLAFLPTRGYRRYIEDRAARKFSIPPVSSA